MAKRANDQTSIKNIPQVLQEAGNIYLKKLQRKPLLTLEHMTVRLVFARTHVQWRDEWQSVIYANEKKVHFRRTVRMFLLLSWCERISTNSEPATYGGNVVMYKQKNAAVHTAKPLTKYFNRHVIRAISWLARSSALNVLEKRWPSLAWAIYSNNMQYEIVSVLKKAIKVHWST